MPKTGLRVIMAIGTAVPLVQGTAALASSPPAVPKPATTAWQVDYGEAQCVAMRNYATKDKPLLLMFKPSPGGTMMRVVIVQKGYAEAHQLPGTVRFGSAPAQTIHLISYGEVSGKVRLLSFNVPMDQFRASANMPDLALQSADESGDFAIDHMAGVVAELDKCAADLRRYWNIDENTGGNGVPSAPVKPLHDLFSPDDYPSQALNGDLQGTVQMTFLVDDKGKVADCSIDGTSGVPVLDTMSCYIIQSRAHFTPAVGADGKPRRSSYTETVTWQLKP
jgi:TonB family protein